MKTCAIFREILCLSVAFSVVLFDALTSALAGELHWIIQFKGKRVYGDEVQRIKRNQRIYSCLFVFIRG